MANYNKSLITLNDPKSGPSEAYRMIRTNIEFSNIDVKNKSIVFTSATTQEGKSTTIANTAIAMAQSGAKVLILDCDLRKPMLHKLFNVSNEVGLVNIAIKGQPVEEVRHEIKDVPGLHVVTCGPIPPMPSELLVSKGFRTMLKDLKETYDYIFMDTPPVLSVTDATILAAEAEGTILIVSHGSTPIEMVKTAKKALEKVNAHLLGVILTQATLKNGSYYYYYDYEYGHDEKKKKGRKGRRKNDKETKAANILN